MKDERDYFGYIPERYCSGCFFYEPNYSDRFTRKDGKLIRRKLDSGFCSKFDRRTGKNNTCSGGAWF